MRVRIGGRDRVPLLKVWLGVWLLLVIPHLVSCGDNEEVPYTWGDISAEISASYCQAHANCGWMSQDRVELCYRHTYHHLCELKETCFKELPAEAEDDTLACSEDLLALSTGQECFDLLSNLLPESCDAVWPWEDWESEED